MDSMKKAVFCFVLFFSFQVNAQTLRYGVIEFSPITVNQVQPAMNFLDGLLSPYDVKIKSYEHTPVAGNEELTQNVLRLSLGIVATGAQLQTLLAAIQTEADNRGVTITKKKQSSGLIDGLRGCYQTHGASLANRPALKTCCVEIFKENRVVAGQEISQFKQLLQGYGFQNIGQFKNWLNQS